MKNDNKKATHSKSNPLKFNVSEPSHLMDFLMKKLDGSFEADKRAEHAAAAAEEKA
jgi:hypothetical protein